METGDYLITKHSNLLYTHIAFHVCCHKQERNESPIFLPRRFVQGISNVIGTCCQYGVSLLTIPIPFLSEVSMQVDNEIVIKQAILVLELIKSILRKLFSDV